MRMITDCPPKKIRSDRVVGTVAFGSSKVTQNHKRKEGLSLPHQCGNAAHLLVFISLLPFLNHMDAEFHYLASGKSGWPTLLQGWVISCRNQIMLSRQITSTVAMKM